MKISNIHPGCRINSTIKDIRRSISRVKKDEKEVDPWARPQIHILSIVSLYSAIVSEGAAVLYRRGSTRTMGIRPRPLGPICFESFSSEDNWRTLRASFHTGHVIQPETLIERFIFLKQDSVSTGL